MAKTGWSLYEDTPHMDMRRPLWQAVQEATGARTVLYPGCYVDVSPSFVFEHVTYVDMDRRCPGFFADADVATRLPHPFTFIPGDYREPIDVEPVDLLLSQYAGPISHHCKQYVRPGGHLLANNSHADAGLAALDPDWELVGVIRGDRVSTSSLAGYFQPKPGRTADRVEMLASQKGVAYTKTAPAYLFRLA